MKISRTINAVDSHTAGEPTRIITGGVPHIPGKTMAEKKQYLIDHMDELRRAVMLEPRGHADMFGSILTAPCTDGADFGIIFMDGGGYLNMCGHGSIGAVTVAIETGMVKMVEPITHVVMDTPAGLVHTDASIVEGRVDTVSITNVPSFLYRHGVVINVPEIGDVTLDIAFGGSFFAILDANQLGIRINPNNVQELTKLGLQIRDIVNATVVVEHPLLPHINKVDLVEIYDGTDSDDVDYKNVVIFGNGQVDRSPCGTGTSAKLATLFGKGLAEKGETFVVESIIGTTFKGMVKDYTSVQEYDGIIPVITGSAYITGFNQFVIDDKDPVKHGFVL